jgi:hypothetical protein
VDFEEMEG